MPDEDGKLNERIKLIRELLQSGALGVDKALILSGMDQSNFDLLFGQGKPKSGIRKVLVTGGAGFIGSNLVDQLVARGYETVVMDSLVAGNKENLNPRAIFHRVDVGDYPAVRRVMAEERPDAVVHMAAQIDVNKSVTDPLLDAQINIMSSINLIKSAQENEVKKVIFSSSGGAIYDEDAPRPNVESTVEAPLSPYGIAKLTVDKYLHSFYLIHGLKYTSLRYGNVYGPRQNFRGEAGVISVFLNKMLRGQSPTIFGDGLQTRDYLFVQDAVRANLLALENPDKVGIYNVGTSVETNLLQLFDYLNEMFGGVFKPQFSPGKPGEKRNSSISYEKIKRELGWAPSVPIKEGLLLTKEYFREKESSGCL